MNLTVLHNKTDNLLRKISELEKSIERIEHAISSQPTIDDNSPNREQDKNSQTPLARTKRCTLWYRQTILRLVQKYIWAPILGLLALYGGIGTYVALRYDVSVLPYTTLDLSKASETRFLITNQGPFDIHNVFYACKYVPRQEGPGPLVAFGPIVLLPVTKLHPHGNFSAYCEPNEIFPSPMPEGTLLDFEVYYTPKFISWIQPRGGELFILKYDRSGNPVWLPVGDMTPIANDLRDLQCPTCKK